MSKRAEEHKNTRLRNCDVGSARQQYLRHEAWCGDHLRTCPRGYEENDVCVACFARWAQMPYKPQPQKEKVK